MNATPANIKISTLNNGNIVIGVLDIFNILPKTFGSICAPIFTKYPINNNFTPLLIRRSYCLCLEKIMPIPIQNMKTGAAMIATV